MIYLYQWGCKAVEAPALAERAGQAAMVAAVQAVYSDKSLCEEIAQAEYGGQSLGEEMEQACTRLKPIRGDCTSRVWRARLG